MSNPADTARLVETAMDTSQQLAPGNTLLMGIMTDFAVQRKTAICFNCGSVGVYGFRCCSNYHWTNKVPKKVYRKF